jgi:histidine triad (HIT) family protein
MAYDDSNVFARILRGEIPCDKVHETEHALAFRDIRPQAPIHVLVIPRGRWVSFDDFGTQAPEADQAGFWRAVAEVARLVGADREGYRMIANHGPNSHQEVPHFHVHILGGRRLGPMLQKA